MSFFSQKKKITSQLRPLSENEIQKKLYGNLRPELLDRPRGGHASEPQQQQSLSFSQPAVMLKETPEQPSPAVARDLFESSASRDVLGGVQPHEIPQINKKEKVTEKNRMERLAQLAEIEKPGKKTPFREDPWKKKNAVLSFDFANAGKFAHGFWGKVGGSLSSAGKSVLGIFVVLVAFGLRLLQSFDLRKPAVRRVIYWVAGAAALFSVFMGIHLLNVRREEAMKAPPKISKTVKKEAAAKKASSAEVKKAAAVPVKASPEVLSPASSESSSSPAKKEEAQAKEAAAAASPSGTTAGASGRYVIQIATFAGPNDAERVQKTLKAAELPVFVKALTRPSGRVYYSVFMGRYASFDEAQDGYDLFRKNESGKGFQDAFIRTID